MPTFGKRVDVPGGRRRAPRQTVVLPASAVTMAGSQSVIVENVCSSGARLRGRNLPDRGKELIIKVGNMDVFANVTWRAEEECGIAFDPPLEQADVIHLKREGRWGMAIGIV